MVAIKRTDGKVSRTMVLAIIVAVLGSVMATLPMVRDQIPKEAYAFGYILLSALVAAMRITTTMPLKRP